MGGGGTAGSGVSTGRWPAASASAFWPAHCPAGAPRNAGPLCAGLRAPAADARPTPAV